MTSCLICGCVKNCQKYLDNVFKNIEKMQKLFKKSKIIISFDLSNDFTLKKLIELKKIFDIDIIINKDPLTNSRTVNIERARNKILDKVYKRVIKSLEELNSKKEAFIINELNSFDKDKI